MLARSCNLNLAPPEKKLVNWNKSDYWETPEELFARGGDCEDFAIAKYAWLRFIGVAEERLRIAIVYDRIRNIPHAVLVIYINSEALVLDNQVREIRESTATNRYRMIYSINRLGWWLPVRSEEVRVSLVHDMNDLESAAGEEANIRFSKDCISGLTLPQCINAVEPD